MRKIEPRLLMQLSSEHDPFAWLKTRRRQEREEQLIQQGVLSRYVFAYRRGLPKPA